MRRREFIGLLGGAAAAPWILWPRPARAQDGHVRRVGALIAGAESDPVYRGYLVTLREVLAKAGWIEGRNLQLDFRYGAGNPDRIRAAAEELVKLAPEVMLTNGSAATRAVQQQTTLFGGTAAAWPLAARA